MLNTVPCQTPIIAIVGWKNSGKTTLTVRLVEEFTRRGVRVAAIKHAHHIVHLDNENTDSARHRQAGAQEVAIVSRERWAVIGELRGEPEPDFEEILARLSPCDLIVVEGYKSKPIPKIEARRRACLRDKPISDNDMMVLAIAADYAVDNPHRPWFNLDDISSIADFVDDTIGPINKSGLMTRTVLSEAEVEAQGQE